MPNPSVGQFACQVCNRTFAWKPELAGKSVKCKCGTKLSVPAVEPAPPAPVAPSKSAAGANPPADSRDAFMDALADFEASNSSLPKEAVEVAPRELSRKRAANRQKERQYSGESGGGFRLTIVDEWWRRSLKDWFWFLIGIIGGPALLVIGVPKCSEHQSFDSQAQVATGSIVSPPMSHTETRRRRFSSYNVTFYNINYQYEVDGQVYTGQAEMMDEDMPDHLDLSPTGWQRANLAIYYLPGNPKVSHIEKMTNWKSYATPGVGLLLTAVGLYLLYIFCFVEPGSYADD